MKFWNSIMWTVSQDLRFGFRLLLKSPGFAVVAVLTLALGIAANTTVFSWVDAVLLRPYPGASDGQQLAVMSMINAGAPNGANQTSYLDYLDYRSNLQSLAGLAVHREQVFTLGDSATGQPLWGELVSGNYFAVLGVKPALGRVFTPEEDGSQLGAYPVAVISHRLWRGHFQADPRIAGKTLRVNQHEFTIAGVAPPEFCGTMPGLAFDIWVPVTMGKDLGMLGERAFKNRSSRGLYALVRLKPGVPVAQARAEAAAYSNALAIAFPKTNRDVAATILPVWDFPSAAPGLLLQPLRILMVTAVLVLFIGCANVASLLLSRSVARRKELSIRLALGAGGVRLSRQLLTETLVLAGVAAIVGLVIASWTADVLPSLVPKIGAPIHLGFSLNGRVLAFTIAICIASALFAGVMPALFWFRSDVNQGLREEGRGGGQGVHSHRTRGLLVIAEVALATLALIGAGLFGRSFQSARSLSPGFDRTNVVMARFYLAGTSFSAVETQQFCLRLRDRVRSHPAVTNASYANNAPLGSNAGPYTDVEPEGYVPVVGESKSVNNYVVSPGYFNTLRIPLMQGRDFLESDDRTSALVMIVNQSFARRYFSGANPVGRKVRAFGKDLRVIGLVKDSKYFDIAEAPRPHFFVPYRQGGDGNDQLYLFIRSSAPPANVMASLRREIAAVDSQAGAFDLMPLIEWTEVTLFPQKVAATLSGALGVVSLVLAAIGLYSVMAYSVSQRVREIGIRMALGAPRRDVLVGVLRRGLMLTAAGLGIGIAVSVVFTRLIAGMLVNVSATDPLTFAFGPLFLTSIALVATWVPAWRATRVDPTVALRSE